MRYRCHECDRRFEDPDIITESHGFNDGIAEERGVCPFCKGYFEEMHKCVICGEYFTDDELTAGVCDECIYEHDTNHMVCYEFGRLQSESIKINSFLVSVFTEEQINEILYNRMMEMSRIISISCYEFIESDKVWFAEKLIEKKEIF